MRIGRHMIAADELDMFAGNLQVGIGRRDFLVVGNVEPVFFPRTGFGDDMKKGKVGLGAVGKIDMVGH